MGALLSKKVTVCLSTFAILAVSAVGCGGDDNTTPGGSAGSGGSGATTSSGGSGGSTTTTTGSTGGTGGSTGGTGGTGGAGGTGGSVDAGDVICGGTTCQTIPGGFILPCCTAANTCGISVAGMCVDTTFDAGPVPEAGPPGVPDPNCSSVSILGMTLAGCCNADNTCGFSSALLGNTCLTYTQLSMLPGLPLPEGGPMSCTYPTTP